MQKYIEIHHPNAAGSGSAMLICFKDEPEILLYIGDNHTTSGENIVKACSVSEVDFSVPINMYYGTVCEGRFYIYCRLHPCVSID